MKTSLPTIVLLLLPASVFAHHSFLSVYDQDSIETVQGVVTEVWFENPHTRVYIEATAATGEKVLWESETYPRNILVRPADGWEGIGFAPDSID